MYRRSFAVAMAALGLLLFAFAVAAQADTPDIVEPENTPSSAADGWQSGPAAPTPGVHANHHRPILQAGGGHPPVGFTQYVIQHDNVPFTLPSPPAPPGITVGLKPLKGPEADRLIKTLRVDLPPGLTVNPEATQT